MRRNITCIMLCGLVSVLLVNRARAIEHTKDSHAKVKKNIADKKALIVDVRELGEWKRGHLKGALLVPLSELREKSEQDDYLKELFKKLPKKKIVYTHCRAGVRALTAGKLLKSLGYDVRPLKAGFSELLEAGFPKAEKEKEEE